MNLEDDYLPQVADKDHIDKDYVYIYKQSKRYLSLPAQTPD